MYLVFVLLFTAALLTFFYRNVLYTGQAQFAAETDLAFRETENLLRDVIRDIDDFITRVHTTPRLLEDFIRFFGSEDFSNSGSRYPELCDSLVYSSGYTIRHILYYSTNNLVDMEYSSSGQRTEKVIHVETAEALCRTGCTYTKDIHRGAAYVGKITFVLDIRSQVGDPFCTGPNRGVWLTLHGKSTPLGDTQPDIQAVSGSDFGLSGGSGAPSYYRAHASEQFGYTAIYTAPAAPYLQEPLSQFLLAAVTLVLILGLSTFLLARQFSRDGEFLETILQSMEQARSSRFVPVNTGSRKDEFSAIADHLNDLYHHLETLIQQKYELTICQQKAQMDMLSAQLNPHFLYNTLERIRMRAVRDGATDVAQAAADLGSLYRNIVKTEPIITIAREMEITRQYLDLMSFLYGDQFLYHCDISPELSAIPTPKIWVQPIVENFFKHNFRNDDRLKVIVLSGERTENSARFQIFDNLGHIEADKLRELNSQFAGEIADSSGIGLLNVYHRLRLFYGDRLSMSIHNCTPAGVSMEIQIQDERTMVQDVPTADCR